MLILDPKLKVKSVSCFGKMGNKTLKGKLIEQAIKGGTTAVPQGEEVFTVLVAAGKNTPPQKGSLQAVKKQG